MEDYNSILLFFFAYFRREIGNSFKFNLKDYEKIAKNIKTVCIEKKNDIISFEIIDK